MPPLPPHPPHPPLAVIGGGNMAQAILRGCFTTQALDPTLVVIAEPDQTKHPTLRSLLPPPSPSAPPAPPRAPHLTLTARDALTHLFALERTPGESHILLATKPQALAAVAAEIVPLLAGPRRTVISILAGTPTAKLLALLGPHLAVVRAMPNLPAAVGQGATALSRARGTEEPDEALARRLFAAVGPLVLSIDEDLMDAFTAVAGSGPAYLFYLAEALTRAAADLGFAPADAERIARQTIIGAAEMLRASPDTPAATLRAAVTSKGGTTEAAIRSLDGSHVMDSTIRAIAAAQTRARELAQS